MLEGGREMTAVLGEDEGDLKDGRDAVGHGLSVPILGGIGPGSKVSRGVRVGHGSSY